MATSGTWSASFTNADFVDESFERCGIDPASLTTRHLVSARRSITLMLADWMTKGIKQWKIDSESLTLTASDLDITLPAATQDVLDMVLRRDSVDTPMMPLSRSEYLLIPNKTQTGRPDRFFVDKQRDSKILYLWPSPENSTDIILYNRLIWAEDTGTAAQNPDIPHEWWEAFAADLAARLALKWAPDRLKTLAELAAIALATAQMENRERGNVSLGVSYG